MTSFTRHEKLQLASSFQRMLSRLHRTKIDEISPFSSLRRCLRPPKWCVTRSGGRNSRPITKLRYPSETPVDTESKQPTRELQLDFTWILPLPKLEKLTAPYFWLNKHGVTDESTLANTFAPCCFPFLLDVTISTWPDNFSPVLYYCLTTSKGIWCGVEWGATPITASRHGNAVSAGHWPRHVSSISIAKQMRSAFDSSCCMHAHACSLSRRNQFSKE